MAPQEYGSPPLVSFNEELKEINYTEAGIVDVWYPLMRNWKYLNALQGCMNEYECIL